MGKKVNETSLNNLRKFQPKWKLGETQVIRVPVALIPELLDIAKRRDSGESFSQIIPDFPTQRPTQAAPVSANEDLKLSRIAELEEELKETKKALANSESRISSLELDRDILRLLASGEDKRLARQVALDRVSKAFDAL